MKSKITIFSLMLAMLFCSTAVVQAQNAGYKSDGTDMVLVEGGTFQMGSTDFDWTKPVHQVTVSDFYMSKYEVTQAQYKAIMGNNPSYFKGDNLPVENVSWYDAVNYCNKRSTKEGLTPYYTINETTVTRNWRANGYRLPTKAEWEYAAKGGKYKLSFTYSGSHNIDEVAWYEGNSGGQTYEVGQKEANVLGIYDMSGNVWEWCGDWYGNYGSNAVNNPLGPASGDRRVIRGGSWCNDADYCRCAGRSYCNPDIRYNGVGFRVVRSAE